MLWRAPSYVELVSSTHWICRQRRWLLRITLGPAKSLKPGEEIALGELAQGQFRQYGCRGNRLLLHPQADFDVTMGVESWACPSHAAIVVMSTPASRRCMAVVCRMT